MQQNPIQFRIVGVLISFSGALIVHVSSIKYALSKTISMFNCPENHLPSHSLVDVDTVAICFISKFLLIFIRIIQPFLNCTLKRSTTLHAMSASQP